MNQRLFSVSCQLACLLSLHVVTGVSGQAPPTPTRIACVGDSITYGAAIREREKHCYPAQLAGLLGNRYEVKNFGRNGATLLRQGDLPYMKQKQFSDALAFKPDIVVIKLGTNDSKPQNWEKKEAEFVGDYKTLIKQFQSLASRPRILICLPVPVARDRWGIRESIVQGKIIPRIRQVARETGVETIDLYGTLANRKDLIPDGVHPNGQGATLLAREVKRKIAEPPKQVKPSPKKAKRTGRIEDRSIFECSGMATSNHQEDRYWVHNDSGHSATLYRLGPTGKTELELELEGVKNIDFEDIASFQLDGRPLLAVADVGDNRKQRKQVQVYLLEEPKASVGSPKMRISPLATLRFSYGDGNSHNCEAIGYLPSSKQLLLCTKLNSREVLEGQQAKMFSLDVLLDATGSLTARPVGTVPGGMITGMDISRDGKQAVIRNYLDARLYSIDSDRLQKSFSIDASGRLPLPLQRQGESICFSADGKKIIVTSEGKNPDIFEIPLY